MAPSRLPLRTLLHKLDDGDIRCTKRIPRLRHHDQSSMLDSPKIKVSGHDRIEIVVGFGVTLLHHNQTSASPQKACFNVVAKDRLGQGYESSDGGASLNSRQRQQSTSRKLCDQSLEYSVIPKTARPKVTVDL